METFVLLTIASLIIMAASLSGVFTAWKKLGHIIGNNLSLWVSFSAGVFLIISILLLSEAFSHGTLTNTLVFFAAGAILVFGVFRALPEFHHHHTDSGHADTHSIQSAKRILFSDAIHNVGDGILLGAAFATSSTFGFLTAGSIFVHELVQEISEFFVLKHAGYSTKRALTLNFMVSGTILIGSISSFFLLEKLEMLEAPILALAAGSFFIVVFHDLIPSSITSSRAEQSYFKHAAMFTLGMALMIVINSFVSHEAIKEPETSYARSSVHILHM